jgi:hypothetical protein
MSIIYRIDKHGYEIEANRYNLGYNLGNIVKGKVKKQLVVSFD